MANIRLVYDVDEDSADYHARRLAIEGRKEILAYQKEVRTITTMLLQGAPDNWRNDILLDQAVELAQRVYLKSLSLSPPEK